MARSGTLEQTCSSPADCDDATPCTDDVCNAEGLCEHHPGTGSTALPQLPYDCKTVVCDNGRPIEVAEPADAPFDACIDGSCDGTTPISNPKPDGSPCAEGLGKGICTMGECIIECADDPAVCDDANPCTTDTCDAVSLVCVREKLDNVPASTNIAGDCTLQLCTMGALQIVPDNGDVPIPTNACKEGDCDNGMPVEKDKNEGEPCGNGVCDGDGHCVGCVVDEDCGIDDDCADYNCQTQSGTCEVAYTDAGTVIQLLTGCSGWWCDGMGGVDFFAQLSGPCNNGSYCDGPDSCNLSFDCVPSNVDPCPGEDNDSDCSESCDESSDSCGADDPPGSDCPGGLCDGGGACISCGTQKTPMGSICPGACTGGCSSGTCNIDCAASPQQCEGDTIVCPAGLNCYVTCGDNLGCHNAVVACPLDYHCHVECNAGSEACKDMQMNCSSNGPCDIHCGMGPDCNGTDVNCGGNECIASCHSQATKPTLTCNGSCSCNPC